METDTVLSPTEVDMQILDLADEVHVGGAGRTLGTILSILRDRGIGDKAINDSLDILWKEQECIRLKSYSGAKKPLDYVDTVVSITTKGKDRLRHLRASVHMNFKLRRPVADQLSEYAGRRTLSPTEAATQFIQEGLRREQFPGIDFRWTRSGRRPFLLGTGLSVWELFRIWLDHGRDARKVLGNYPHLAANQVQMGVAYAERYLNEMPPELPPPPFATPFKA